MSWRGTSWSARSAGLPVVLEREGLVVREAVGARARRRGLAGVCKLDPGHGLWFDRCRSVHTAGMRFALDLVWLDAAGAVVRLDAGVRPRRVRSCRGARSVVELHAGEGERFVALGVAPAIVRPVDHDVRHAAASFLTRATHS